MTNGNTQRILILSHAAEIANSKFSILTGYGFNCKVCDNFSDLCKKIQLGVGSVLISQETIQPETLARLCDTLKSQPAWSQVPIVVMLNSNSPVDGNEQWLQIIEPLGYVTLVERPVSEKVLVTIVRTALAFRERQYDVGKLLGELEISNRVKTEFLANVSHEIRTPLCAILGFSELLMDRTVSLPERQAFISTIRRNGRTLSGLIDDILDLTRVESGEFKIQPQNIRLENILDDVVSALDSEATKKGLSLAIHRTKNLPEIIRADSVRLRQVLKYLVDNAIKFTRQGVVTLRILGLGQSLRFEIEDTGIGISPEQSDSLFRPFCQGDSSSTRNYGGSGVGLALSRKLARAMGGDLELAWSVPGGGSCFALTLANQAASLPSANCIAY